MKILPLFSASALVSFTLPLAAQGVPADYERASTIVNPSLFFQQNLTESIQQSKAKLSDGREVLCWVIPIKSEPVEHAMGPWCPTSVTDDTSLGGKWFFGGELVDVDGEFIKNLAQLYEDNEWNLVNDDGTIRVTDTEEAFNLAARPDVDEEYHNYCVEAPADLEVRSETYYTIPVYPVMNDYPTRLTRGGIAVAFNGVNFDPPAPTSAILAAHTIAPLDDHGGHLNPHEGYHYHAATGSTKEVLLEKGHAPLIGYVIDGFPLHAHKNAAGEIATDLDECGGHQHPEDKEPEQVESEVHQHVEGEVHQHAEGEAHQHLEAESSEDPECEDPGHGEEGHVCKGNPEGDKLLKEITRQSGYHYHAGAPGSNQIIKAFRGTPGSVAMPFAKKPVAADRGGKGGPRGEGPPPEGRPPRGKGGPPPHREGGPPPGERPDGPPPGANPSSLEKE